MISGYVYVRNWFYTNTTAPHTSERITTILGAVSAGSVYLLSPATVTYDPAIADQPSGPLAPAGVDWPTIVLRRRRFLVLPTALGGGG